MKKKILFRGFDVLTKRMVGYADVFIYSMACYLKGKELGYSDVSIVFPRFGYDHMKWHVPYDAKLWQKTRFLPWTYVPRGDVVSSDRYDRVVDTSQPDSLYPGFPGLHEHGWFFYKYPDVYFLKTGRQPVLPRDTQWNNHFILFHYRNSTLGAFAKQKVTPTWEFKQMFTLLRKCLDGYEFWKIGEPSRIDHWFDKVLPSMYDNIDGFAQLISNASLFVGGHSGPRAFAYFMEGLPVIQMSQVPQINPYDPEAWRRRVGCDEVKHHPNWCSDRLLSFTRGNLLSSSLGRGGIQKDMVVDFIGRHGL